MVSSKVDGKGGGFERGYAKGEQEGYQKGVAETQAQYIWVQYMVNLGNAFYNVEFPANTELHIHLNKFGGYCGEAFQACKNLVSLKLSCNEFVPYITSQTGATVTGLFRYNSYIKKADISELKCPIMNAYMAFNGCLVLEEIIGELKVADGITKNVFENAFSGCYALREVRFAQSTILNAISFANSSKLSDASIQSVIDGLTDLTGAATQTLSFHKDVGAKLTPEQKAAITAKNWTLVY